MPNEEVFVNLISCIKFQYDSIRISATFPKMYLQHADSIKLNIDTLSKKGYIQNCIFEKIRYVYHE